MNIDWWDEVVFLMGCGCVVGWYGYDVVKFFIERKRAKAADNEVMRMMGYKSDDV